MGKILLTSNGLTTKKIIFTFKSLFNKPIEHVSVLFIPTASRTDDENIYVMKSYNELLESGVSTENIIWFNIDKVTEFSKYFDSVDCIFICGGNTYYLLSRLKKFKLEKKIINAIKNGTVYVGVSAGSIITSPTIEHIYFLDENDIGLSNLNALNLTKYYVVPHYQKEFNNNLISKTPFMCITDESAILYEDNLAILV